MAVFIIAAGGAVYFYLLLLWLASAIAAGELSKRKGYGEKFGLGTGLLLSVVGAVIWAVVPPRKDSPWRQRQAMRERAKQVAAKG
jgi:hypothetical protein